MKNIKLKIEGMDCSACAMNIDLDLEEIPGIKSSKTSYARQETIVEYDEKKVNLEKILTSIKNTGYKASL